MASTSFTFLNVTGAPKLSKAEAKRRRGHITKVNFASRRERKAESEAQKLQTQTAVSHYEQKEALHILDGPSLAIALSTATSRTDPYRSAQLLVEFWSLLFLDKEDKSGSSNDTEWLNIHASEPALVEATMVVAIRYWSPDALYKLRADLHSYRALRMIMQRIESKQAYTEGFIFAALVMAIGDRLVQNDAGWEIHMNGVVQAIKERRSRNLPPIPPILTSLLILDSTNSVFGYPRMFHSKVVDLAEGLDDSILSVLVTMSQGLSRLRKWANAHSNKISSPRDTPPELEALWVKLYIQCKVLGGHSSPFVRATSKTTQIILHLSSPPGADENSILLVADELKQELSRLPGRSCWCLELTSCQVIMGAIVSARGSETRAWFMGKLKTGVATMRDRGWDNPFAILERVFATDEDMLRRLKALWKEEMEVEHTPKDVLAGG